jgi:nucleosome binding factor SPN SPT16 subunit
VVVQSKGRKDLADALPKEIGFGIGLELREKSNVLTLKNFHKVKPGMVFNVAIGEALR